MADCISERRPGHTVWLRRDGSQYDTLCDCGKKTPKVQTEAAAREMGLEHANEEPAPKKKRRK